MPQSLPVSLQVFAEVLRFLSEVGLNLVQVLFVLEASNDGLFDPVHDGAVDAFEIGTYLTLGQQLLKYALQLHSLRNHPATIVTLPLKC